MTAENADGENDATPLADADLPHRLCLRFDYDTERRARIVERSVGVEVGEISDARSAALVDRDGTTVRVRIDAADLVALRAGSNSWLRLLTVAESVATATDG